MPIIFAGALPTKSNGPYGYGYELSSFLQMGIHDGIA